MELRPPEVILEEIQEFNKLIKSEEKALQEDPDSFVLNFILEQNESRKAMLLEELRESYAAYHCHTIDISLEFEKLICDAKAFINSLGDFFQLLDSTLNFILNTRGKRFSLAFNTQYRGSFAVLLSTPYDGKLLSTDYEETLKFVFANLAKLKNLNEDELSKYLQEEFKGNKSLMTKYQRFLRSIMRSKASLKLEWQDFNKETRKIRYEEDEVKTVYKELTKKILQEKSHIIITGEIISMHTKNYRASMELNDGRCISLYFGKDLKNEIKKILEKTITCKVEHTSHYNEKKDKTRENWKLIRILKVKEKKGLLFAITNSFLKKLETKFPEFKIQNLIDLKNKKYSYEQFKDILRTFNFTEQDINIILIMVAETIKHQRKE